MYAIGKEHGCAPCTEFHGKTAWGAVSLGEKGNAASRTQSLEQAQAQDGCGGPGVWLLWVCCCREECEQFLGRISPQDISIRKGLVEQG